MQNDMNDLTCFDDDIYKYLEYDEENEFIEWYSIEGAERISELSRQLRTFINFKKAIIHLRFSRSKNHNRMSKDDLITKYESNLITSTLRFITLLKMVGIDDGVIVEKIRILINKLQKNPNKIEINQLKEINFLCNKIWKLLHILSELEINNHPQLISKAIKISSISCEVKNALFPLFSDFYSELKKNYLQLDNELSCLLRLKNKHYIKIKKKKIGVRVVE
jgi:hypothetical protein